MPTPSPPPSEGRPDGREQNRPLHPLPRGLVELYGLLAVLVVLIPEWMASGAMQGLIKTTTAAPLPGPSGAWRRLPELKLAAMSLAELRLLARQLQLPGYAALSRDRLSARLLKAIRRRREPGSEAGLRLVSGFTARRVTVAGALLLLVFSLVLALVGVLALL